MTSPGHTVDSGSTPPLVLVADMSLALINRTGAFHVCREISEGCADLIGARRFWRFRTPRLPAAGIRHALARLMFFEIGHPALSRWLPARRRPGEAVLYMDPLYVLGEVPGPDDIVLCHDMGPVTHPALFGAGTEASYRRAFEAIRQGRPGMVFVSKASRTAFTALYGESYPFLEVIPLFVRDMDRIGPCREPQGVGRPYLLMVAALEHRKNHLRTFQAFARSGLAAEGYRLVICGPHGNATQDVLAAAAATPGVLHLGYVTDAELNWLYRNAAGFVLPSLLEGFGMPALEAARHGLLSLVGQGAAQREAVGEGAVFVDESSVGDIARGLRELVTMDGAERQARIAMARRHAAALSRQSFLDAWRDLLGRRVATRGNGARAC